MKHSLLMIFYIGVVMTVQAHGINQTPVDSVAQKPDFSSSFVRLETSFLQQAVQHETSMQSVMRSDAAERVHLLSEIRDAQSRAAFAPSYTDALLNWFNGPTLLMGTLGTLAFLLVHAYYSRHVYSVAAVPAAVPTVVFALPHQIDAFYCARGAVQTAFGA